MWQQLWEQFWPWYSEHLFDVSFWVAIATLVILRIITLIIGVLVNLWRVILMFFQPTVQPGAMPVAPGPSPFKRFIDVMAGILLLVTVGIMGWLIYLSI